MQKSLLDLPPTTKRKSKKYFISTLKRDGQVVPYDPKKIIEVLMQVSSIIGDETKQSINLLNDDVEAYLRERYFPGETLSTKAISFAIEHVLREKRSDFAAKAYIQHRQKKVKLRKKLKVSKVSDKSTNSTDIALMVITESKAEMSHWNKDKIAQALVKEAGVSLKVAKEVAQRVEKKLISSNIQQVTTGLVRELVDNELIEMGHGKVMKKQTQLGMPIYNLEALIFSKSNENSNLAANNPEAVNLSIAENTLKQYALENIFTRDIATAHLKGALHLHDLGYPTRVYCSTHSLEYIKKYGLDLENLNIISSPAKHARTLTGHLNTFLASMQAYYAGALGIAYTNIAYAPYLVGMSYKEMIQEAQYLIYSCAQNAFSRGGQTLFIDFNIHTGIPVYLKDVEAIGPGGKYTGKTYAHYEKEAQMFAKAMMEVWRGGDANGHVFEFPKMDVHINQESFDEPSQYELLDYAATIASENGSPYFVFDRDEVTLSQCCRLRTTLDLANEDDMRMVKKPESMRFCGFQNITLNLPQAAYKAGKGNIKGVCKEIDKLMDLCLKAHLQKKKFISRLMTRKGLPLWQIGKVAKDGFPYVDLDKSSYIVGMIGLNECLQYLTGKQLHDGDDALKTALQIIAHMYLKINELSKKSGLKFVLEESPAESAARRVAKIDLQEYPEEARSVLKGNIKADEFYYTNSIHFTPNAPISLIDRIEKQSKFHSLIAAGAIIHAFVGEERPSTESIVNLVRKTWDNTNAAQICISPEFSICNSCHNMIRGIHKECTHCGAKNVAGITTIEE